MVLGPGGRATGISRSTISRGIREVESGAHETLSPDRTRRPGGGRKRTAEKDATLVPDLEALVEPTPSGGRHALLRGPAQLRYSGAQVRRLQNGQQPASSVDTKKKELVGDFKTPGRAWRPEGSPAPVRVHDFLIPGRGKAIPYGVYDLSRNEGWVSVGIDHDTASFAVK